MSNNKTGLWDVLKYAERDVSLDSIIHYEEFNDFTVLFKEYPNIKKILFNGKQSAEYF